MSSTRFIYEKEKKKNSEKSRVLFGSQRQEVSRATLEDAEALWKRGIEYHRGSGHPNYHPKGDARYILLDAYAKELPWFANTRTAEVEGASRGVVKKKRSTDDSAPLRIVDTHMKAKGDVWVLEVPLVAQKVK